MKRTYSFLCPSAQSWLGYGVKPGQPMGWFKCRQTGEIKRLPIKTSHMSLAGRLYHHSIAQPLNSMPVLS